MCLWKEERRRRRQEANKSSLSAPKSISYEGAENKQHQTNLLTAAAATSCSESAIFRPPRTAGRLVVVVVSLSLRSITPRRRRLVIRSTKLYRTNKFSRVWQEEPGRHDCLVDLSPPGCHTFPLFLPFILCSLV